ncbi:DapH/DapD/GlmU-related protein, partial [Gelidibacter salicanalis]
NESNLPVIIEDDVWIGRNVVILPGIRISSGSIVGANSVVTKNICANSIVGGVPAKFIKFRQ